MASSLFHFPIVPFSWTVFSSPSVTLSEIPSLRIKTLLSQCNYICQTHPPVCPKNASVISLLMAEIVPRSMWRGNCGILFGRVANYTAYFFSSLQLHFNSRTVNICICLHLWQLSSEIRHCHCVESKSHKYNCPASMVEFFFDLECSGHSVAIRHGSWIIWPTLHALSPFITYPSRPRNFNT